MYPRSALLRFLPVVLAVTLGACSDKEQSTSEAPPALRPAKLITLKTSTDIRDMQFPAVIEADKTSDLSFKTGGRLEELSVQAGDRVKKGQIIGRLDQSKARSDLTAAKVQFENAQQEFERAERLIKEKAIAKNVYEQRKTQAQVAGTSLATARKNLEETALYIPFSGVVASVQAERFENIQPNQTVVTLQSVGSAKAVIKVPASLVTNASRIEPIETFVSLDASPGTRIPAKLDSSDTVADSETQTFRVDFAFKVPDSINVLPGMTATVEVKFKLSGENGETNRLTVPLAAIQSENDVQYVWLVDEAAMTVSRQDIKVARGVGEALTITQGLKSGDVIVGAGASYMQPGMKIKRYEQ